MACIWAVAGRARTRDNPTSERMLSRFITPSSVDPHGAEGDAFDVPQPDAHARIEHLAEPEVGAETECKVGVRRPTARGEIERRLRVGHDAHLGVLRIHPPPEGKAT